MPGMENAYALVVGIANYQHINPLPDTVLKDARDIRDILVDPDLCGYAPEHVQLLLDEEATSKALRKALAGLANQDGANLDVNEDSTVFIYISSHGGSIESGPQAGEYLLAVDTNYKNDKTVAKTAISGAEFSAALNSIPARKIVVVFDCCHAGGIGEPKDAVAPRVKVGLPEEYYEKLKMGRGRVILASSRSDELSYVLPGATNSLFTQHLLDGLRGGALGSGGFIRIFDIFDYLQPRVTGEHSEQHPIFKAVLEENFPIALYSGGKEPVAAAPAPLVDDFKYDAFISYRGYEPDKSWVRKTLVPALEAEGLSVCIDYKCFAPGGYIVKEMERAVVESRYTVAVLSPKYLESGFTEFEELLAQHLGLEKRQNRFLGVLREPCTPSLRVRARFWLDMTGDEEYSFNLPRIVDQLRQTPDA